MRTRSYAKDDHRSADRRIEKSMLPDPVEFDAVCPDCEKEHRGTSQFPAIIESGRQICVECLWDRVGS